MGLKLLECTYFIPPSEFGSDVCILMLFMLLLCIALSPLFSSHSNKVLNGVLIKPWMYDKSRSTCTIQVLYSLHALKVNICAFFLHMQPYTCNVFVVSYSLFPISLSNKTRSVL